jgi:hypothetical protein
MQFFGKSNQINRLLRFTERNHLSKNATVLIQKEIFRSQIFNGGIQRVIVQQDGAEYGTLGVEVAGEGFFEGGISGHELLYYFAFSSLLIS